MSKTRRRRSGGKQSAETPDTDAILPPTRDERLLPFYKKDGDARFEDICVEIAQNEDGIETADKKNAAFRAQYGVDVEAFDRAGDPILVISCKNYQKIDAPKISEWSDDFLNHWEDHWKGKGVKSFVLAVTIELNADRLRAAIWEEKKRFAAVGIAYECWGTRQLTSKLRPYPALVTALFNAGWAEAVCGTHVLSEAPSAVAISPTQPLVGAGIELTPASVFDALSQATERSLEDAHARARGGDPTALSALLANTRRDHVVWEKLDARVRARFLRSDALRKAELGDLEETRGLLDAADMLAPPADRTARALVLYKVEGLPSALAHLSKPASGKECHLRSALLMEAGRLAEASELLNQPLASEPSEERLRLSTILAALQRNNPLVRSALEELSAVERRDFTSSLALIALRFFLSLAPGSPLQLTEFPNPIPLALARQDDEARSLREDAIALCDAITPGCDEGHRAILEVWKLACLLVDEVHHARGLRLASDLVRRAKPHPVAVAWALAYGAQIDLKRLRTTLEARVAQDKQAPDVAALALIARLRRGPKAALRVIEKHGQGFRRANDVALMAMWQRDLSEQQSHSENRLPELIKAARRSKNATALISYLATPAVPPEELAAGAEFLAQSRPADLNAIRQRLVALGTARALELAIQGASQSGEHAAIPELISLYQRAIGSRRMPYRIRLTAADAGWRRGDLPSALHMLELDGFDSEAADAALRRARLFTHVGNIEGAARLLRIHRQRAGGIDAALTLDLAYHVRAADPALAREIAEEAGARPLEGAALGTIYRLADELGLSGLQQRLTPVFAERAARGEVPNVVLLTAEQRAAQVRRWSQLSDQRVRLWLQGEVPVHAAFDQDAQGMLSIFFGAGSARTRPMLLRGAREAAGTEIADLSSLKVRVDVTGLLVAVRFGLLDLLDMAGEVWVPVEAGAAILELEHAARALPELRHAEPVLKALRQRVASNLETSRWKGLPPLRHGGEGHSTPDMGPLVRTLLDVLGNPVAEGTVCWLEDRHASLFATVAGGPRVDVISIYRFLKKGQAGGAARAERLRRDLSAAGYIFNLWSIDDIAAAIRSANSPTAADVPARELLDARDYFVLEVLQLANLNRTVIDADSPGLPVEMRYAGRALHLAPRLMAHIWSEGDEAGAIWRSRWAWRNLRREQMDSMPAGHNDTVAKRNLRFLSLVELAMSVAIGDWGPELLSKNDKRRQFLAWAFAEVIEPMIAVEPDFEARLVDQLSSSLKEFLETNELRPDQRPALAAYIDSLVSCFPEGWAKRIRGANGLETVLGQRTEDIVTVAGDVVFRVQDFAAGVADALVNGSATVARVQARDTARLLHVQGRETLQIIVDAGGQRIEITDASFGLLSADEAIHCAAATTLAHELDCPPGELGGFIAWLLQPPDPAARLARVAEARKDSYREQLRRLEAALRRSEEIDYALLKPPAPDAVARYLRLQAAADAPRWTQACEGLADEIGVLAAAKRVAATTLRLSPSFKRRFGTVLLEEWKKEAAPAHRRAPTPLYALLFAESLMMADAPQELIARAIGDLARSCSEDGPAFCSVLNWSRRVAAKDSSWQSIDQSLRELLLMVHADMVLGTLVVGGADPGRLAEVFDASDEPQLQAHLDRSSTHAKHPFENSKRLTGHIVAALLEGAEAQSIRFVAESGLRAGIALHSEGRWLAHPKLLELATPWHPWSWANRDPAVDLAVKGLLELPPPFDLRDAHALVERILQLTEEHPAAARFQYLALLDLREASDADLESIARAMAGETINGEVAPFSALFHVCCRVMMNVLGALGRKKEAVALAARWARIAAVRFGDDPSQASLRPGSHRDEWPAASQLADICLGYVFGARDATEATFEAFTECLEAIAQAWPPAADACADLLVQAADQVDVTRARHLWMGVQRIRLRVRARRISAHAA